MSKPLFHIRQFLLLWTFAAILAPAVGAEMVADLPRSLGEIEIDGVIGDGEWADAVQV